MAGNKLGRDGLSSLWTRIYNLIKLITGDVEVTSKGTLQAQINNIKTFVKSGSSAAGGLVPKPPTTAGTTKYLREDGTWQVPPDTNTTYSNMTAATASAAGKAGLVPAPAAGAQAKFLRGDGTWQTPTDTDTKNTAGTTNKTATKMYLAGATSQAANPVTYSNSNCYIGTDNELYSAGKKVAHQEDVDTLNSKLMSTNEGVTQTLSLANYEIRTVNIPVTVPSNKVIALAVPWATNSNCVISVQSVLNNSVNVIVKNFANSYVDCSVNVRCLFSSY